MHKMQMALSAYKMGFDSGLIERALFFCNPQSSTELIHLLLPDEEGRWNH